MYEASTSFEQVPVHMETGGLRKPSREITRILADNIRNYRRSRRLSQEELANICNLHRTHIGSVERGERNVTLSTLESLAAALDVSVPQLLTKRETADDV